MRTTQLCENVGEKLVDFAIVMQRIVFGAKILVFQNSLPASLRNELSATPTLRTVVGLIEYLTAKLFERTFIPPCESGPTSLVGESLVGRTDLHPKIVQTQ